MLSLNASVRPADVTGGLNPAISRFSARPRQIGRAMEAELHMRPADRFAGRLGGRVRRLPGRPPGAPLRRQLQRRLSQLKIVGERALRPDLLLLQLAVIGPHSLVRLDGAGDDLPHHGDDVDR